MKFLDWPKKMQGLSESTLKPSNPDWIPLEFSFGSSADTALGDSSVNNRRLAGTVDRMRRTRLEAVVQTVVPELT